MTSPWTALTTGDLSINSGGTWTGGSRAAGPMEGKRVACYGCGNPWTCSFRRKRVGNRGGGTGKNGNAAFVT